jgi:hypothetical protein
MLAESTLYKLIFIGLAFLSLHFFFYTSLFTAAVAIPLYIFAQTEQVTTLQELFERLLLVLMRRNIVIMPSRLQTA